MLRLLGEVTVDGRRPEELGPPKQRCVLAALAIEVGQVVVVDRLARRVWGEDVPSRARETLHSYVSRLRHVEGIVIERRSGGYVLTAPPVDLHMFRELCAQARTGDAVVVLTQALQLWHGEALTGLDGEWADAERARLAREHLAARLDLTDALLRADHGAELLSELAVRAEEHPLDERIEGQLLTALHQSGRTADALEHYRIFRARLVDELGTEPGTFLRDVHQKLLTCEPTSVTLTVPRQLPAAPRPFVGREDSLARLDALEPITAIAGTGGIGKTWLALHWAHRNAARFPDGQLFVDLRGFAPEAEPMDPAVAVRGFLDALGADRVPPEPQAQAALFRSLVADRRILLVLDNAADTTQVAPLLPGGGTCAVIVTSRNRLTGLITRHSAHHVALDVLPDAEAHALLSKRIGPRVASEPDAVSRLIALCGGFPLALGMIAAHAHTRPHVSLAALADELSDLDDDDPTTSFASVLSWSVRALTPLQAQTFAQLAIAPGDDISLDAACALTGLTRVETRTALRGLEQASLLGLDSDGRYRMHDLVRRHAATLAQGYPRLGIPSQPSLLSRSDKIVELDSGLIPAARHDAATGPADRPAVTTSPAPGPATAPATHSPTGPADRQAAATTSHSAPSPAASPAPHSPTGPADRQAAATTSHSAPSPAASSAPHSAIGPADLVAALCRVTDFYVRAAHAADRALNPHREPIPLALEPAPEPTAFPDDRTAMDWFDAEHRVLIATQQKAAERGCHHTAWNLAWALETYHRRRGFNRDRLEVWQTGLNAVVHTPNPDAHILTHRLLGRANADLGRHDEADDHLHKALALAERHGDRTNQAHIHRTLAQARAKRGETRKAHGHALEALHLCRGLDNPVWEARALNAVGWYAAMLGDHDEAHDRCTAALRLSREHNDQEGIATTLDSLGFIAHGRGDHAEAVEHYEAALKLCRELGFSVEEAATLDRIAESYLALGDPARAKAAHREAENVRRLSQS